MRRIRLLKLNAKCIVGNVAIRINKTKPICLMFGVNMIKVLRVYWQFMGFRWPPLSNTIVFQHLLNMVSCTPHFCGNRFYALMVLYIHLYDFLHTIQRHCSLTVFRCGLPNPLDYYHLLLIRQATYRFLCMLGAKGSKGFPAI